MLKNKTKLRAASILLLASGLMGTAMYGCQEGGSPTTALTGAPTAATTEPAFALFGPPPHRSGVQLWSDTCARCHNSRPPQEFSGLQWAIVVHHMRMRANLTGDEEREIVKFLQASN